MTAQGIKKYNQICNEVRRNMDNIVIPKSNYIVIDDVGWKKGTNGSLLNEPYRTGMKRNHCAKDYQALYALASKLNMKLQIAFVAGEWDKNNILRNVPHSNWMWKKWNNTENIFGDEAEIIDILNVNKLSIAVHALCHEFWHEDGTFSRAEFGPKIDLEIAKLHLNAFFQILKDNHIDALINSFVPPAFMYTYDNIARLLAQFGIQYISTPFQTVDYAGEKDRYFMDNELIVCDRTSDLIRWDVTNAKVPEAIKDGFFGMHFPNILAEDPSQNLEVVDEWVCYFNQYKHLFGQILAKDEVEAHSQTVYQKELKITEKMDHIMIEGSAKKNLAPYYYLHSRIPLCAERIKREQDYDEYKIPYKPQTFIAKRTHEAGGAASNGFSSFAKRNR